jgi:uncharacterized cupredoxin-like copper-binding protein
MHRLAAAVVSLIALGGCGGDGLPAVHGPTRPALDVTGTEMRFDPAKLAVAAGDVRVVLHNAGLVRHDLRIEGKPALLLETAPGETATATWRLPAGRYRTYCSLPGHRPAGMEGMLEVRKGGSAG